MRSNGIRKKTIAKNLIISVFAQVISLLVSFILSMIVPKYISEGNYAYWQTFLLYVSYVGILNFGLLDGMVLRYSQYDYEELDKPLLCSQFRALLFCTSLFSLVMFGISAIKFEGTTKIIMVLVAAGVITKNVAAYTSYLLQITNRISKYATLVIMQRVTYGILAMLLIGFKVHHFYWFCIADLLGDVAGIIIGRKHNRNLYFGGGRLPINKMLIEVKNNVLAGAFLLIANWSSMLLTGAAKMFIQWNWNLLIFGKVAFAFSISNLFLTFISALSVVLFPSIKRMKQEELPQMYKEIGSILSLVLMLALLMYYPGYLILERWIPRYQSSLVYLGVLLPVIIYSSKVTLLTNNYLKAYREEKKMLLINVFSVAIAFVLYFFSAYIFNNITLLLASVVIVMMIRSIASEMVVMKKINISLYSEFIIEGVMTVLFIISVRCFVLPTGFLFYLVFLCIYYIARRERLTQLFTQVKSIVKIKR